MDRNRLPAPGAQPLPPWADVVGTDAFKAEASQQSALVSANADEQVDQAFVDAASAGVWDDE